MKGFTIRLPSHPNMVDGDLNPTDSWQDMMPIKSMKPNFLTE